MAQLDFFGLDEDFYSLMQFVFSETNMIVYEAYSRVDRDIRQFKSVNELRQTAGERLAGGFLLRGWFPDVMEVPLFETFKLKPEIGDHRTSLEGVGVVQFAQGIIDRNHLKSSSFSHWNEAGAVQRCIPGSEEIDWGAMRLHSGRLHRHVRSKLATAKLATAAVLPHAHAAMADGLSLWYGKEYRQDSLVLRERPNPSVKGTSRKRAAPYVER